MRRLENIFMDEKRFCTCREIAKSTRKPRTALNETSLRCLLDRQYSDVIGSVQCGSYGGSKYFVILLDEYSTYSIVRFVDRKSMAEYFVRQRFSRTNRAQNKQRICVTILSLHPAELHRLLF